MLPLIRFLLLVLPFGIQAQFNYVLDQSIPVRNDPSAMLLLPWAGGLNAAHYNTLDLNGDGRDDLVLYDRMGDRILTFLNLDNMYLYAPEYETFFPKEITNWLLLRDYNCDGRKDIFTGNIQGIKVYINVTAAEGNLSWEEVSFYAVPGERKSTVLLTKGFLDKINLQLQFDDLPSIVDADGDGDLDIFNIRYFGQGTIEYHQNFSMERYGTCDSLDFERITQTWGNVTECGCADFAFNGEDCGSTGGRVKHAGGKSLLMLDIDANGSLDALFSEAECNNLYALPNTGSIESPVISSYNNFPESTPVDFPIFPAPFYEDVDFDGRKDLIAIPNIFSKTSDILNADLSHSNWVYKNYGTNESPDFSFTTNSFLQEQMIDVGDNA
ncbi:MAG TPA: VCBS repeat-containing protein, partial [Chryseolinea sp.]|nr:VCBS repeat-containing protein [Chryseolinea sp.]